jgi:large subunit ribosomal protein L7A
LAESKNIKVVYIDTMRELGKMCSIEVGSSATLIL